MAAHPAASFVSWCAIQHVCEFVETAMQLSNRHRQQKCPKLIVDNHRTELYERGLDVDLSAFDLSDRGKFGHPYPFRCRVFATCLKYLPPLSKLNLNGTRISARGAQMIAESLVLVERKCDMQVPLMLNLLSNSFRDDAGVVDESYEQSHGQADVSAFLQLHGATTFAFQDLPTSSSEQGLGMVVFGGLQPELLRKELETRRSSLTSLTYCKSSHVLHSESDKQGLARVLNDALTTSPGTTESRLAVLDIRMNNLGLAGIKALIGHQGRSQGGSALRKLDLSYNAIGREGAEGLCDWLSRSTSIEELHLAGNLIGEDGATEVVEHLFTNLGSSSSVKRLNLMLNGIGDACKAKLIKAVQKTQEAKPASQRLIDPATILQLDFNEDREGVPAQLSSSVKAIHKTVRSRP